MPLGRKLSQQDSVYLCLRNLLGQVSPVQVHFACIYAGTYSELHRTLYKNLCARYKQLCAIVAMTNFQS